MLRDLWTVEDEFGLAKYRAGNEPKARIDWLIEPPIALGWPNSSSADLGPRVYKIRCAGHGSFGCLRADFQSAVFFWLICTRFGAVFDGCFDGCWARDCNNAIYCNSLILYKLCDFLRPTATPCKGPKNRLKIRRPLRSWGFDPPSRHQQNKDFS